MAMTITQSTKRDVIQKITELLQNLKAEDHNEVHQNWKNLKVKIFILMILSIIGKYKDFSFFYLTPTSVYSLLLM